MECVRQGAVDVAFNLALFFLSLSFLHKNPEGVVVGLGNFAWAPSSEKYYGGWGIFDPRPPDTCANKIPLMSMGGQRRVCRVQTREQVPPLA